jgi:hypothetical protein
MKTSCTATATASVTATETVTIPTSTIQHSYALSKGSLAKSAVQLIFSNCFHHYTRFMLSQSLQNNCDHCFKTVKPLGFQPPQQANAQKVN